MSRCPIPDNARYVGRTSMMDRRGEGVPIILRESETLSGHWKVIIPGTSIP